MKNLVILPIICIINYSINQPLHKIMNTANEDPSTLLV
jgi:hypothetical protein